MVTLSDRRTAKTHPLYEIQSRSHALEREIIETKMGDTEAIISHQLTLNMLVSGLIAVALAEVEKT